jgi:hypothetical protein
VGDQKRGRGSGGGSAAAGGAASAAAMALARAAKARARRARRRVKLDMVLSSAGWRALSRLSGPKHARPADESYVERGLPVINEQNEKRSLIIQNCSWRTLQCERRGL